MTDVDHQQLFTAFARVVNDHDWARLADYLHPDAVVEYPQSGERFRGVANIRAQFENYPDLEAGSTELEEVIGGTTYALTPIYTVIAVEGSGSHGTAIIRVRYPDGSRWWVLNLYEIQDGMIGRQRNFFAPEFEAPDWRAPYREAP